MNKSPENSTKKREKENIQFEGFVPLGGEGLVDHLCLETLLVLKELLLVCKKYTIIKE